MKNFCIIFLTLVIISLTAVGFGEWKKQDTTYSTNAAFDCEAYLRVHIRADSDEAEAQAVKYKVRDAVVAYLTPLAADCGGKAEAVRRVEERLSEVAAVADETLRQNGYGYGASARIERETFPTRVYGEYTLPSGEYSALIVRLGRGEGANWWCVIYPPLCFAGTETDVRYKSKIKEIIERFYD